MPTMFTLPWRWTTRVRPAQSVVFASRFDARGLRARWILFWAGIRLRRAVLASPGSVGVSLRAHPFKGRYYTLSMWNDEESLLSFARGENHAGAVRAIRETGPISGVLISRLSKAGRPGWREIIRWVDATEPGPYQSEPVLAAAP